MCVCVCSRARARVCARIGSTPVYCVCVLLVYACCAAVDQHLFVTIGSAGVQVCMRGMLGIQVVAPARSSGPLTSMCWSLELHR